MATPAPRTTSPDDHRPTTDSFMLADYEFAIDRVGSTVEFDDAGKVRTFAIRGDAEVYRQLSDDSAFPFDFAHEPPTLYAAGVFDDERGGPAEHISTADGDDDTDGQVHGAYLDFGKDYSVDLAILHAEGWVIVEGSVELEGRTYAIEVRMGVDAEAEA